MDILNYFKQTIEKKASDLHLAGGSVPALRINKELVKLSNKPVNNDELKEAIYSLISKKTQERFRRKRELDISKEFFGFRFRINLHYQEGKIGLTARLIPNFIPRPEAEEIDFSEVIYKLTHLQDGLILVTGPSGSGKSTTLASMIDIINQERKAHIITIEDPIEYLFKEKQSIIEQRELGQDTRSFAEALKHALRQDPNVIMVGEMRDIETVSAAMTAAETGHLVISTLHTPSAAETIARIIDIYPHHQQEQILNQLSYVLRAVIAQQLLPGISGGLAVAREILINNRAVANLIRTNQLEQINSVIQTGYKDGMISLNRSIDDLRKRGLISEEIARRRKRDLGTRATYY